MHGDNGELHTLKPQHYVLLSAIVLLLNCAVVIFSVDRNFGASLGEFQVWTRLIVTVALLFRVLVWVAIEAQILQKLLGAGLARTILAATLANCAMELYWLAAALLPLTANADQIGPYSSQHGHSALGQLLVSAAVKAVCYLLVLWPYGVWRVLAAAAAANAGAWVVWWLLTVLLPAISGIS